MSTRRVDHAGKGLFVCDQYGADSSLCDPAGSVSAISLEKTAENLLLCFVKRSFVPIAVPFLSGKHSQSDPGEEGADSRGCYHLNRPLHLDSQHWGGSGGQGGDRSSDQSAAV